MKRRVRVEIDLSALVRNYMKIAAHVAPAKVLCVLKANAYGLGVAAYAKALAQAGCTMFGVAEPYEALELVNSLQFAVCSLQLQQRAFSSEEEKIGASSTANCKLQTANSTANSIQILSSILPDEIDAMVEAGVILPVIDIATAKLISEAAKKQNRVARVHFKLDTGMGRLGIIAEDALATIRAVSALPNLDCEGIFTHCPMAYDPHDPFTKKQIALFKSIVAAASAEGYEFRKIHMAASDAINNFRECAQPPFNIVRTGINLHGSFDPNGRRALAVEPVLTLKTRIAQVRTLKAGTTLGYGRTWCLREETRVATISAGYADGLPLALTNRGQVLINGVRCPVVGRISMDYATVDVSQVPDAKPGDDVICLGTSGTETITPDDWAALKGTHAYDIICSFGTRVQRITV